MHLKELLMIPGLTEPTGSAASPLVSCKKSAGADRGGNSTGLPFCERGRAEAMTKHLDVLLALVALVGLANGLARGAGGGGALGGGSTAGGTGKTSNGGSDSGLTGSDSRSGPSKSTSGVGRGAGGDSVGDTSGRGGVGGSPGESAVAKSGGKPSNGGNSSLLSGGTSPSGQSNSSSGGEERSARDVNAGGISRGPSGSNREPENNPTTNSPSRRGSNSTEDRNRGPGAASSAGNQHPGGSGLGERTPGSSPLGSDSVVDAGSRARGLGSTSAGVGRTAGASGGDDRRLGGVLFDGGQGFPGGLGESGGNNEDEERDFSASGSLSRTSSFGGGARNSGFSGGASGFGTFGSPDAGASIGEFGGRAGANAGGRGPLDGDQISDEGLGFGGAYGGSGDFHTSPGSRFSFNSFSRGSSGLGGEGFYGDFGGGSSGEDFNGGAGGTQGGSPAFGAFGSGSSSNFGSAPGGLEFPAGLDGAPGINGRSTFGDEVFPGSFPEQGPGAFSGSATGPGGSTGWPTRRSFSDFGSSGLDSSPVLSSPVAPGSRRSRPSGLWPRLWRRGRGGRGHSGLLDRPRKPDPRLAAAVALRTLAGAAAIGRVGVRIATAIHDRRRNGQGKFGGHSGGCVGRDCARQRRLYKGLKFADAILTRFPANFARLY